MEKQRWEEESKKRKEEERRSEKRRQQKEDQGVLKNRPVAKHYVF